jgi:AraC-like DNA-binding protein
MNGLIKAFTLIVLLYSAMISNATVFCDIGDKDSLFVADSIYYEYETKRNKISSNLAIEYLDCAENYAPINSDLRLAILLDRARLRLRLGDLNTAYNIAHTSLKGALNKENKDFIGDAAKVLLEINSTIGNDDESLKYLKLCFDNLSKSSDSNKIADSYQAMGSYYRGVGKTDIARFYLSIALSISLRQNNELIQLKSLNNIGLTYASGGDLITAKSCFLRALKLFKEEQALDHSHCEVLNNISYLYLLENRLDSAKHFALLQLELSKSIQYHLLEAKALFHLSEIYKKQNQFDSALVYYQEFDHLNDSLFNEGVKQKIRLNDYLDEIENLEVKNELNRINLQNLRFRSGILLGFAAIAIAALIFLYWRYRSKQNEINELFLQIQELIQSSTDSETEHSEIDQSQKEISFELTANILQKLSDWESENGFTNETTLESLSKICETNTRYLSATIKAHFNQTFPDYINSRRIKYILRRLERETELLNYTIEAISNMAGYKSSTSFVVSFKKITQLTPSTYLKERRKREKS